MDSPTDDAPNIAFLDDAQAFLDRQPLLAQSEIIAVASWLYGSPEVDGEKKFLILGPRVHGIRVYRRVYLDDAFSIVYEFNDRLSRHF